MKAMKPITIRSMSDVRIALNDELNTLRSGNGDDSHANSVANIIGKIMHSVKIDVLVHKYVSSLEQKEELILNTKLIPRDLKKSEDETFESESEA